MESRNDRRRAKRYSVECGAIVYLKKKPFFPFNTSQYIQLGPVSDISSKGMSINYFSGNNKLLDSLGLAISTTSGKIIIDDVRFETVYDVDIASMPDGKKIKKRAMKFLELSGYQSAWLACLIHNLKSRQIEIAIPAIHDDKPEILREIF